MSDEPTHLFGPVPSRRLRRSLGVDLVPMKTCSFDCVYCQLGRTTDHTLERQPYVPASLVIGELEAWLADEGDADTITMSGSGEPTLSTEIGEVIRWLKQNTAIPVAVLTNGSLLWQEQVREDLCDADLLIPSLDSATESGFRRVNRPVAGLSLASMIEGVAACRQEFVGRFWLEVMLVSGLNDTNDELDALRDAIARISPDCVQLNTVVRPPAMLEARRASPEEVKRAAAHLGAEIIAQSLPTHRDTRHGRVGESEVARLLQRRPCTIADVAEGLSLHPNEAVKLLQALLDRGEVDTRPREGDEVYFAYRGVEESSDGTTLVSGVPVGRAQEQRGGRGDR